VLNCKRTPNPRRFPYIVDPQLLALYLDLLDRTGAETVLLSTWRHDPVGMLAARHFRVPVDHVIPDMQHHSRGAEISSWLKTHPEVSRYIVLDDEDDQLDDMPVFQPSSRTGLTSTLVDAAAAYLNGETDACARQGWFFRKCQNIVSYFRRRSS
jgi:Swiss Army Knife RNA repair-like protein